MIAIPHIYAVFRGVICFQQLFSLILITTNHNVKFSVVLLYVLLCLLLLACPPHLFCKSYYVIIEVNTVYCIFQNCFLKLAERGLPACHFFDYAYIAYYWCHALVSLELWKLCCWTLTRFPPSQLTWTSFESASIKFQWLEI